MAYGCGYGGGYDDLCVVIPILCGGGYGAGPYAAMMYGGAVPCINVSPSPDQDVQSNVQDHCILDSRCFIIGGLITH